MKKIILIACLLAWQGVAAAPAKPAAHVGKPAASASKKTAVKPAKAAEKGKDKTKTAGKGKDDKNKAAEKKVAAQTATAQKPAAPKGKTAAKAPAPKKAEPKNALAKHDKAANKKASPPAKTDKRGKSQTAPLGGSAKTRHTVLLKGKKYIGTPYLWGGTTPKGFDCSGLIHYLYHQEGVDIPRNSREQFSRLQATSEPQPGDLVFFRKKGVINHVGLYLGGGRMLHAPQTGMTVRVENIKRGKWPGRYAGARKALKDKPAVVLAANSKGKKAADSKAKLIAQNHKATDSKAKLVAKNSKAADSKAKLVAKNSKAADNKAKLIAQNHKAADSKAKLAQRKAVAANSKRLATESKTIHSKGRVISAR